MKKKNQKINNLIIVSDLHCGCRLGLCPANRIKLDDGGEYFASEIQNKVWTWWREFWNIWVPEATKGEPFAVCINGDVIDGVHHNSTTQISHNLQDQKRIAIVVLKPIVKLCEGRFYMVRGTKVHVGESGCDEENIAEQLGAIPDEEGRYARWELWCRIGKGLVHCMHHIGTTGSAHYESTAVTKELTESYTQAGRNRLEPPDVVVRSHRHRHIEVRVPTSLGYGISFVTAGWQLRTPFAYKIPGGRVMTPQIGGSLIRQGDEDLFTRHKIWDIGRSKVVENL
jgi:hypothetical protein